MAESKGESNMLDEVSSILKTSAKERLKSHFFLYFIFSWLAWNYKVVLTIVSSESLNSKFNVIEELYHSDWFAVKSFDYGFWMYAFILPAISSLFAFVLCSLFSYACNWFGVKVKLLQDAIENDYAKKRTYSVDEVNVYTKKILDLEELSYSVLKLRDEKSELGNAVAKLTIDLGSAEKANEEKSLLIADKDTKILSLKSSIEKQENLIEEKMLGISLLMSTISKHESTIKELQHLKKIEEDKNLEIQRNHAVIKEKSEQIEKYKKQLMKMNEITESNRKLRSKVLELELNGLGNNNNPINDHLPVLSESLIRKADELTNSINIHADNESLMKSINLNTGPYSQELKSNLGAFPESFKRSQSAFAERILRNIKNMSQSHSLGSTPDMTSNNMYRDHNTQNEAQNNLEGDSNKK